MNDRKWIYTGLGAFVAIALFPAWYGALSGGEAAPPELEYPATAAECVESAEFMRAHHPSLLDEWRDAAVREGRTEYTSSTGAVHTVSLTGTCMSCHDDEQTFCARCHDYADVNPSCWECHVTP